MRFSMGELRKAVNHHGDSVEVGAEEHGNNVDLTFFSETGKDGTCEMTAAEAWLYASDIISVAMKVNPELIESYIKTSVEKYLSGDY